MYRKFIATIVAAAITVTVIGATPARADNDDLKRALTAILGIAVVGAIINENRKDKRAKTQRAYKPKHYQQVQPRRQHVQPYVAPRPLPQAVNRKLLPGFCLRSFDTDRRSYQAFGQRCLQKNYRFARSLPDHCLISLRTRNGNRNGYEARCLRDAGYRLARS